MPNTPQPDNKKSDSVSEMLMLTAGIFLMTGSTDNTWMLLGGLFLLLSSANRINHK